MGTRAETIDRGRRLFFDKNYGEGGGEEIFLRKRGQRLSKTFFRLKRGAKRIYKIFPETRPRYPVNFIISNFPLFSLFRAARVVREGYETVF